MGPYTDTPALFTQVSNPPKCSRATSAMRRTSRSMATSATTQAAAPPRAVIASATSERPSPLRAASTTRAPRAAASRAVAMPIPLEAPVITTVWSSKGFRRSLMGAPRSFLGRAAPRAGGAATPGMSESARPAPRRRRSTARNTGSALGGFAGRRTLQVFLGQRGKLLPDPGRHVELLLHDALAGARDLRLAGGLGGDHQRLVAAGFELLEGMAAERVLQDLVAGHGVQHALHVGRELHRGLLEGRRVGAEPVQAPLDLGLLLPGLVEVRAQAGQCLGVAFQAVDLGLEQLDRLALHGVGVAQPAGQVLACGGHRLCILASSVRPMSAPAGDRSR